MEVEDYIQNVVTNASKEFVTTQSMHGFHKEDSEMPTTFKVKDNALRIVSNLINEVINNAFCKLMEETNTTGHEKQPKQKISPIKSVHFASPLAIYEEYSTNEDSMEGSDSTIDIEHCVNDLLQNNEHIEVKSTDCILEESSSSISIDDATINKSFEFTDKTVIVENEYNNEYRASPDECMAEAIDECSNLSQSSPEESFTSLARCILTTEDFSNMQLKEPIPYTCPNKSEEYDPNILLQTLPHSHNTRDEIDAILASLIDHVCLDDIQMNDQLPVFNKCQEENTIVEEEIYRKIPLTQIEECEEGMIEFIPHSFGENFNNSNADDGLSVHLYLDTSSDSVHDRKRAHIISSQGINDECLIPAKKFLSNKSGEKKMGGEIKEYVLPKLKKKYEVGGMDMNALNRCDELPNTSSTLQSVSDSTNDETERSFEGDKNKSFTEDQNRKIPLTQIEECEEGILEFIPHSFGENFNNSNADDGLSVHLYLDTSSDSVHDRKRAHIISSQGINDECLIPAKKFLSNKSGEKRMGGEIKEYVLPKLQKKYEVGGMDMNAINRYDELPNTSSTLQSVRDFTNDETERSFEGDKNKSFTEDPSLSDSDTLDSDQLVPGRSPIEDVYSASKTSQEDSWSMYENEDNVLGNEQKEKKSSVSESLIMNEHTPKYKWRYAPSLDIDTPVSYNDSQDDEVSYIPPPLKTCTKGRRVGLSRKHKGPALHPNFKKSK